MRNIQLPFAVPKNTDKASVGAACVTYYDPYIPRALETIKSGLAAGHPILVRWHAAAEYPVDVASDLPRDQIDLEGHAVLVVGFDDETGMFAIADPSTHGLHDPDTVRWVKQSTVGIWTVDCSLGMMLCASPPKVDYVIEDSSDGTSQLVLTVGFDTLPGQIMDRKNFHISAVEATLNFSDGKSLSSRSNGEWYVGDRVVSAFTLQHDWGVLNMNVNMTVSALRPYPFHDVISTKLIIRSKQQVVKNVEKRAA